MPKIIWRLFWRFFAFFIEIRNAKTPNSKNFPICNGKNYFYDKLVFGDRSYFTKYFLEKAVNPLRPDFKSFKSEILPGYIVGAQTVETVEVSEPSVIPVCINKSRVTNAQHEGSVEVLLEGQTHNLLQLRKDRFYYIRADSPGKVQFNSPDELTVGDPIAINQTKRTKRKLVICLFIDSLSWEITRERALAEFMPNTARYFSKGTIFDHCYTTGNWTLTSAGSIVSGLNIKNHGMFHPTENIVLNQSYKVLAEYFKDAGYLTFQCCGNWRKTPGYGYVRGFDRSIYKSEMGVEETIYPFIDNLRGFSDRSQFAWLSLNDAHHEMRGSPEVSVQLDLEPKFLNYGGSGPSKTRYTRNEARLARYIAELKKIDFFLGVLFSYLESNYSEDEILVSLFSDHGINYYQDNSTVLDRVETHTAFMLRGGDVPSNVDGELIQTTDILPTLLHCAGIDIPDNIDGQLPFSFGSMLTRETVVSELVYPGTPYLASIKDKKFDLRMESSEPLSESGDADLDNCRFSLYEGSDYLHDRKDSRTEDFERLKKIALKVR